MSMIDKNKPVWKVTGIALPPDGRRHTVIVNAEDKASAIQNAILDTPKVDFNTAWEIDSTTGLRKKKE